MKGAFRATVGITRKGHFARFCFIFVVVVVLPKKATIATAYGLLVFIHGIVLS